MSAQRCPACGRPNDCAVAREGDSAARCWCMERQWTQALPEQDGAAACWCRACLQAQAAAAVPGATARE